MSTSHAANPRGFRYIGTKRRTKEDPRFVSGRGRYAADIALPGLKHVALVASPHASARIVSKNPSGRERPNRVSTSAVKVRRFLPKPRTKASSTVVGKSAAISMPGVQ